MSSEEYASKHNRATSQLDNRQRTISDVLRVCGADGLISVCLEDIFPELVRRFNSLVLDVIRSDKIEYFKEETSLFSQEVKIRVFFELKSSDERSGPGDPSSCYFLNESGCFVLLS